MAERIVVSGGAGFIGSRLVRRLLDAGHQVAVLDSLIPSVHGEGGSPPEAIAGARFLRGDVRDGDAVHYRPAPNGVNVARRAGSFLDAPDAECKNAPVASGL